MSATEVAISRIAYERLRALAVAAYPDEGCGVLIGVVDASRAGIVEATSARNLNHERARDRYDMDPGDIVRADRQARASGLDVVGFWHSHPDHPARPSQFDTDRAWTDYVYIICATTRTGAADVNAYTLSDEGGHFVPIAMTVEPVAETAV